MPSLPMLDLNRNSNESPHVFILGAGASLAACPSGDATGKPLPLMNGLADALELRADLTSAGFGDLLHDFEGLYEQLAASGEHRGLVRLINDRVHAYFSSLQLPAKPTIYDYLVLSLRKKDLIATFNWDPLLAHAYRRNMHVGDMPQVAFLHGNVAIGICREHKRIGFIDQTCVACRQPLERTPLLYPVGRKDYSSDEFIASQWDFVRRYLGHAYFVTIFGYSAPASDAEARQLMLEVWRENQTAELARFTVVDIKDEASLNATWDDFKVLDNLGTAPSLWHTYLMRHPRRSCDAFAMATLQQRPWPENPWPEFEDLHSMQNWIAPLASEEPTARLSGQPLPRP